MTKRKPEPSADEIATIRAAYAAGQSIRQIAAEHERSYGGIRGVLLRAGVHLRGRGGSKPRSAK